MFRNNLYGCFLWRYLNMNGIPFNKQKGGYTTETSY